jgi:serine/threonine protein kinase
MPEHEEGPPPPFSSSSPFALPALPPLDLFAPAAPEQDLPDPSFDPCEVSAGGVLSCRRRNILLLRTLSEALFGVVKEAVACDESGVPILGGERFAVKIMKWSEINKARGNFVENPYKEIGALSWLGEPGCEYVMSSTECLSDAHAVYLVSPLYDCDLFEYVLNNGGLGEAASRPLFSQIVKGALYCHRREVCHHDISLENTLVRLNRPGASAGNGRGPAECVIMDFGMSLRMPMSRPEARYMSIADERLGKRTYMAPEISERCRYDGVAVDVFALASVLFMMILGIPGWQRPTRGDPLYRAIVWEGRLGELLRGWGREVTPDALHLLQRNFSRQATSRMSVEDVLRHAWFQPQNCRQWGP